ncbi:MAG TPA: flagellar M-ring protein FliF C-terminal domain-containing protein [Chthonomonadaceae bacterium]|nr:flagellar M-ring protein FliF C-terminal domain-containing protein [Chthonomonadaceae bacterium]
MINRIRDWWDGLATNNKVILAATAVGGLIALIGFIAWANTPEYRLLYTGLSATDASTITDKLRESNVPYRLSAGGTAIEVPQAQHDEVMLKLASLNIQPTNGDAAWGDDKDSAQSSSMVPTPAMEDENIRKAREGEVSRVIGRMQPISTARVMYTPGDASPYSVDVDKHEASASVIVNTRQGQTLSDENVQAIVRLVQMAFRGLSDQKITVSDTRAQMLWDGTESGRYGENMLSKQQRDEERRQTASLQAALNQVWPNKTVVHVHVEKSRDHKVTHKTTTEEGPVASSSRETEEYKGAGVPTPLAAAGATANGVGAPAAPAAGGGIPNYVGGAEQGGGAYTHETKTETRAPSTVDTTINEDPGKIEKFTVSALVDKAVPADEIPKIQSMLASAIGVTPNDPAQERQVVVEQVQFEVPKPEPANANSDNIMRVASLLVPLALMVVCFILLARALRVPMRVVPGPRLALQGAGGLGAMLEGGMPGHAITGRMDEHGDPVGDALALTATEIIGVPVGDRGPKTYDVIEEAFDSHLESILHMARSKPETVSALLKTWLADD